MRLRKIPIDQITIPEIRVTAFYDEETERLLKDSLKAAGIINPIILTRVDDRYELVDGLHRLEEARSQGQRTIDAVVREGKAEDTILMNLILNKLRGKTRASEMVAAIGSLYKDHRLGPDQIQEKTGLSRDYVERLISISQASKMVQDSLDEEIIGVGAAFEIARLFKAFSDNRFAAISAYNQGVQGCRDRGWDFNREYVEAVLRAQLELCQTGFDCKLAFN